MSQPQQNKKKQCHLFETYINKVMKQIAPSHGITSNAKQQLNNSLRLLSTDMSYQIIKLTEIANKKTVSVKEVQNVVKMSMCGELETNALTDGDKAVEKYQSYAKPTDDKTNISRQEKAGIIFPPAIIEKLLRQAGYNHFMITDTTPVFFAAVIEYICAEILDLASRIATDDKHIRITIRDIELAVRSDVELNKLFQRYNIQFLGGGIVPFIHSNLLRKNKRGKNKIKKKDNSRKFRPGTVSIRDIKKLQKQTNLIISRDPFKRAVRKIVEQYQPNTKVQKDVFTVLQYVIEQYVVDVLRDANLAAIHSKRVKLMAVDIAFVNMIRTRSQNPSEFITQETTELPVLENNNQEELEEEQQEEELEEQQEEELEEEQQEEELEEEQQEEEQQDEKEINVSK